jgi:hypothetical protein
MYCAFPMEKVIFFAGFPNLFRFGYDINFFLGCYRYARLTICVVAEVHVLAMIGEEMIKIQFFMSVHLYLW